MIAERMVYSPAALSAAALLVLLLLGPVQQVSPDIEGRAGQALFCRELNLLASSGHKLGWCA
ncbi:hypothetical protein [Kribbella sp. CA-294648]|uniref:hypothetical protein n=1 Tax=Kribbella sp. CA-294648 TaxID=3239948 RepID=UPI003D8DA759